MATPLATVAQLGAYMQVTLNPTDPSALLLLDQTSAVIRTFIGQEITAHAADVELCTPQSGQVFLKQGPVTAVSKVEVLDIITGLWSTAPATAYSPSLQMGTVSRNPIVPWGFGWPTEEETWRVTYDHGYATVPSDLAGVCYGLAARFYSVPVGVDLERVGQRQVKYSLTADAFNDLERAVLIGYKNMNLA